jgi:hypothetical protein
MDYKEAIKAQAHKLSKWAQESRIKVMADWMAKITAVASEKVGNTQGWVYDHAVGQRWRYPCLLEVVGQCQRCPATHPACTCLFKRLS